MRMSRKDRRRLRLGLLPSSIFILAVIWIKEGPAFVLIAGILGLLIGGVIRSTRKDRG